MYEQRYMKQIELGNGHSVNLYGSSKKVSSEHLVNYFLCANHICLSARDFIKSSQKEQKKQERKKKKVCRTA
jgi:hypothetical protein